MPRKKPFVILDMLQSPRDLRAYIEAILEDDEYLTSEQALSLFRETLYLAVPALALIEAKYDNV